MIWRWKRDVSTRYTTLISTEILGCFYTFWWLILYVNSTRPQGIQIFGQTLFLGISVGVFIFLNSKIKSFQLAFIHFYFPGTYPGKFADSFCLETVFTNITYVLDSNSWFIWTIFSQNVFESCLCSKELTYLCERTIL